MISPSINSTNSRFREIELPVHLQREATVASGSDRIELPRRNSVGNVTPSNPYASGLGIAYNTVEPYPTASPIGVTHVEASSLNTPVPITIPSGFAPVMAARLCTECNQPLSVAVSDAGTGQVLGYTCTNSNCSWQGIVIGAQALASIYSGVYLS